MKELEEKYQAMLKLQDEFEDRVYKISELKLKLEGKHYGNIDKIEYDSEGVDITYLIPSHCSCCSDEYEWESIKMEELFMDLDEYEKVVLKQIKEKEELKKKKEEDEIAKNKAVKETKEKEELKRLTKKYKTE